MLEKALIPNTNVFGFSLFVVVYIIICQNWFWYQCVWTVRWQNNFKRITFELVWIIIWRLYFTLNANSIVVSLLICLASKNIKIWVLLNFDIIIRIVQIKTVWGHELTFVNFAFSLFAVVKKLCVTITFCLRDIWAFFNIVNRIWLKLFWREWINTWILIAFDCQFIVVKRICFRF